MDMAPKSGERQRTDDGDRLLIGRGRFTSDISLAGMQHVAFVRAPSGPAAITIEAGDLPTGAKLLTAADLSIPGRLAVNAVTGGTAPTNAPPLIDGIAAASGQPVALIAATTRALAQDAAAEVFVDADDAGVPLPRPATYAWSSGDFAAAEAVAVTSVTASTRHARLAPSPMEPRAAMAIPTPDGLHLILPTQAPWRTRDLIADALGIPAANIRVEAPDVGGAFGMKASPLAEEVMLAAAALALQTPLRWVSDRSEDFLAAPQARGGSLEGTLLLDSNGRFLGLRARVAMPMGHMLTRSALVPLWNAARILPGPYSIPAMDVAGEATADHFAPVGIYRGAGRPEAALFMERLVDCAAAKIGADPLELRRANIVRHFPVRRHADARLDSGDYRALLDAAANLSAWDSLIAGRDQERGTGKLVGVGIAMFVEPSGQGSETARVRLGENGEIVVSLGSTDQGQGRAEVVRAFTADVLKVPAARVAVRLGDTDAQHDGLGALASRSTPIGMPALLKALEDFANAARTTAARELGETADALVLGPGGVAGATGMVYWARLAEHNIDVTHTYEAAHEAWGSGVAVASVEVDHDTGTVTVRSLFAVDDAGTLIDPRRASAQVVGGSAQGLGEALMEQLVHDDGELLTGSFMDYAMPRAEDMPPIIHHSIETPAPDNPIGGKGIGEAGCIGVPAAILNAVHDALAPLGVTDLTFPLTPSRVWDAMSAARRSPDVS